MRTTSTDLDGNRIAEYGYDAGTGTSTRLREDFRMNGAPVRPAV